MGKTTSHAAGRLAQRTLAWPIIGGFVMMAAMAIGTGLTIQRFRQKRDRTRKWRRSVLTGTRSNR